MKCTIVSIKTRGIAIPLSRLGICNCLRLETKKKKKLREVAVNALNFVIIKFLPLNVTR